MLKRKTKQRKQINISSDNRCLNEESVSIGKVWRKGPADPFKDKEKDKKVSIISRLKFNKYSCSFYNFLHSVSAHCENICLESFHISSTVVPR